MSKMSDYKDSINIINLISDNICNKWNDFAVSLDEFNVATPILEDAEKSHKLFNDFKRKFEINNKIVIEDITSLSDCLEKKRKELKSLEATKEQLTKLCNKQLEIKICKMLTSAVFDYSHPGATGYVSSTDKSKIEVFNFNSNKSEEETVEELWNLLEKVSNS